MTALAFEWQEIFNDQAIDADVVETAITLSVADIQLDLAGCN